MKTNLFRMATIALSAAMALSVVSYAVSKPETTLPPTDGEISVIYSLKDAQPHEKLITAGTIEQAKATGKPLAEHNITVCGGGCGEVHFPDDLHDREDRLLRETFHNSDGTEVVRENYQPQQSKPLISVRSPEKRAWMYEIAFYDATTEILPEKNCNTCNGEMQVFDRLLWEINQDCGHGILAKGYHCDNCDTIEATQFFTRCGCSNAESCRCTPNA